MTWCITSSSDLHDQRLQLLTINVTCWQSGPYTDSLTSLWRIQMDGFTGTSGWNLVSCNSINLIIESYLWLEQEDIAVSVGSVLWHSFRFLHSSTHLTADMHNKPLIQKIMPRYDFKMILVQKNIGKYTWDNFVDKPIQTSVQIFILCILSISNICVLSSSVCSALSDIEKAGKTFRQNYPWKMHRWKYLYVKSIFYYYCVFP